ncbi:MAG: hypothetical protein E7468_04575 [Ruminococcaceae bacterium]|nr:hypothetical protein [Oscillospiraceae bacterium]
MERMTYVLKMDKNSIILAMLIMIQPILDIASYFAIQTGMTSVTSLLRLAIFGVIMVYAFILSDRKKVYYIFAGILGAYWIVHMLICARDGYSLVSDANGFLRTIQMPALTLAFITLFQRAERFPQEMGKYFGINYIIIGASILLSFAVNMPVYTYYPDVGIKGWFYTGNSQSFIISVMAMLAMFDAYQKKNNLVFILTMAVAFTLMFLLGTLVALYSIFIATIAFLVLILWNREKRWVVVAALVVAMVVTVFVYPYSPSQQVSAAENQSLMEWEELLQNQGKDPNKDPDKDPGKDPGKDPEGTKVDLKDTILEDMEKRFGYDKVLEIYGGQIDASELLDSRGMKVNFGRLVMAEKDIFTWLFGFEDADMYFEGDTFDPENDFPAIFFFYGIVGIALYAVFLGYFAIILIKDIFKNLKKPPMDKVLLGLSLVLSMGCAELSANVLRRPNASIYISLMLAYAYYICKIKKEQK